jgi:hypothetical protein
VFASYKAHLPFDLSVVIGQREGSDHGSHVSLLPGGHRQTPSIAPILAWR